MFDVVTFGSAVVDIFVDTDVAEKKGNMCYPTGSKILLKNMRFDVGGGGTNTAVAFSRLGLKTGWISKIGDDLNGQSILNLMKKENVRFLGKIQKNHISGHSIILDSRENNRTILTYKGINDYLGIQDIKLNKIVTKWIYYSSSLGKTFETQKKIASILKKSRVKIAFNPSEYLIRRKNLTSLLKLIDVLILNKEEAEMLTKSKGDKNIIEKLHRLIDKKGIVVITDKNRKIQAFDGVKKYSLRPNKIRVVERTGAGDAFASGFVAGQIVGKSILESLKLGLKEGEFVIRHFGAKNNLIKMRLK